MNLLQQFDTTMLTTLVMDYATRTIGALLFLVAAWVFASWSRRSIQRALERARFDPTLRGFVASAARWAILLLGLIASLGTFGIQTTSFAAAIGAAGLAVALAFQGSLSNLASGVMLLVFRPFTVGDVVTVGGVKGKVAEIQLFTTTVDTSDNRRIFIPNTSIVGDTIENATYHAQRRVDVAVGADYAADIDATREVLERAIGTVDGVLETPEPQVYLNELGASSVNWMVRVWAQTPDYWDVRERLTRAIKVEMDAAAIGIPFPQMDVHLRRAFDGPQ